MKTITMSQSLKAIFLGLFLIIQANTFAQKACKVAMTQTAFAQYKAAISGESFTSNQMERAKRDSKC